MRSGVHRLPFRGQEDFTGLLASGGERFILPTTHWNAMERKSFFALGASLVVLLAGCDTPRKPALRASDYRGTIRLACVGDSITYGVGVENRQSNCYPVVLGKLLGSRVAVRNFGASRATLLKQGDKPDWNQGAFHEVNEFAPQAI